MECHRVIFHLFCIWKNVFRNGFCNSSCQCQNSCRFAKTFAYILNIKPIKDCNLVTKWKSRRRVVMLTYQIEFFRKNLDYLDVIKDWNAHKGIGLVFLYTFELNRMKMNFVIWKMFLIFLFKYFQWILSPLVVDTA